MENDLGYWFRCDGCQRTWSQRFVDQRTKRCLPCARAWRRDDMMSRRRGLGGVPLTKEPEPHPMSSRTTRSEIDLNSEEARRLIQKSPAFRAEVDEYIASLVAKNVKPRPPLHGVVPLLSAPKTRVTAKRVEISTDDAPRNVSPNASRVVDKVVDGIMDTIDGEIVDVVPPKSRRRR